MAQINREREDKFFEILGQLKSEFYRDLGCKYRQGYWLNDSFLDVVRDGDYRPIIGVPVSYPILNRCTEGDGCRFTIAELEKAIEDLFRGIENNVDLLSGMQQERYIYSLLAPFNELCGIKLETFIKRVNKWPSYDGEISREKFEKVHRISGAVVFVGPLIGSDRMHYAIDGNDPKDVCTEEQQEVADVLFEMYYNVLLFEHICNEVGQWLDALLLERGINLLWYQNQCGVHLVKRRIIMKLSMYLGTPELVRKYIDEALPKIDEALPKIDETSEERLKQKQEIATDIWSDMPKALQTDEAREIFKCAEDAGLLSISGNCVKWNGEKQLLAYFAARMSERFCLTNKLDKDGHVTTAWKPFEILFDVQDLKGAKQNWMRLNTKFEPTGFEKVDALF